MTVDSFQDKRKMDFMKHIWVQITQTTALGASGEFERYFFESIYRVTYITGLSSVERNVFYQVYRYLVKFMIAITILGEIWYAYSDSRSMDETVAAMNVILIHVITVFKAQNLANHKEIYKKISTCMDTADFIMTPARRQLVQHWKIIHEGYIKLLLGLGNATLLAWHLYPLYDEMPYNLMVGVHLPFRYDNPFLYPLTYISVGICFYYVSYFCMVVDLVLKAHFVPLVCKMNILSDCFENVIRDCSAGFEGIPLNELVKNNEFTSRYLNQLRNLVKQHELILKYAMDLRAIQRGPMLAQMASSGTLICLVGFQATTAVMENLTKFLMSVFYLGYNMYGLYTLCRWCEEVTVQSDNIGKAVYFSGWEGGLSTLPGVRTTIQLIIMRANKPLVFTASGMYDISLKSFNALVKTSYSALTVLLRFKND